MQDHPRIFELFPPLVLICIIVGIAWLVFPFIVMGRLKTMIKVMENSLTQLHHIGNLIDQIRVPAELIPPPAPPVEAPPRVNMMWATCLCQVCSKDIGFVPTDVGKVTTCPHCGMETQLYSKSE